MAKTATKAQTLEFLRELEEVAGENKEDSKTEPVWKPLPGPQTMAYTSLADETFYGGAAGGGKSDLILGLALTSHSTSIIFRREYPQLKGLVGRCKKILKSTKARYNSTEKTWSGLPDGRSLEFGACATEDDVEKFQGRPHDLKAVDEITHFSKSQYKFLTGWLRTDDENQRCRVICTGNPPTNAEGRWVIEYWAPWLDKKHPNPADPGELRYFAAIDGVDTEVPSAEPFEYTNKDGQIEVITPRSRTFIPAKIEDNPIYMKTGYKSVLQSLPEPLRSQMLKGDFTAGIEDDPWQIIPTLWIEAAQERWHQGKPLGTPQTLVACDPARGGVDKTIIGKRYGNWLDALEKHPGSSTPDGRIVADLIHKAVELSAHVLVDVTGIGSSPKDFCTAKGLKAIALSGSEGSDKRDRSGKFGFKNKRAEWHWHLRELLDPSSPRDPIALPDDPEVLADLTAPRWFLNGERIQVEAKEDIKKRIGRSPDCGDTVVYAFAEIATTPVFHQSEATWTRSQFDFDL